MDFIDKNKYIILLSVSIVLIVILISLSYYITFSNNFLSGLWVCDDGFCAESEINQLLLYIGEYEIFSTRKVCVVMIDSNNVPFQFTFDMSCNPITKTMKLSNNEEDIFPNSMNMELSFVDGSLLLSDDEQEYARLYKDNINNN